jgi:hypothetical protein
MVLEEGPTGTDDSVKVARESIIKRQEKGERFSCHVY